MKRYMYAKIPADKAISLGIERGRKILPDGHVLINEGDLFAYGKSDDSFEDKVAGLGGVILTNVEAKQELDKTMKS